MEMLERILNKFSIYAYKSGSDYRSNVVAAVLLLIVVLTFVWMVSSIEHKLVFIIDDIELRQTASLTIGRNSDICFRNVPDNYLRITPEGRGFRWEVNSLYHDSLQYFKVNNVNPNKHVIRNDESQHITVTLSDQEKETKLTMTGADVWRTWKDFKEQQDVLLRHFATYYLLAHEGADSLMLFHQMQQRTVRSFFERRGKELSLIILDEHTQLSENGNTIGYVRNGVVKGEDEQGHRCKVQFFSVSDYCYMNSYPDRHHFQINGVNYAMKPTVKLTEWGAGHVMVENNDGRLTVRYPRPITFVGSVDSLRKKSAESSMMITLKQDNNAFPAKSDLYLPAFSNAINFDLCHIEFFHHDDSLVIRDNSYQSIAVENPHTTFLPFALIPALKKMTLQSGNDTLHGRVGFINGSFIMSYLWLPLMVLCMLLILIWFRPVSELRLSNKACTPLYNPAHIKHFPSFLTMLLLVCMAYCICKSLIALKLSYTYPYFEKITGIIPLSTAMTMLLFFSISMLINSQLRHYARQKSTVKATFSWLLCMLLTVSLAFVFFRIIDKDINQGVILSYFHSEVYQILPWRWLTEYGINDTHRSVVYALFFAEATVLLMWLTLDLFWEPVNRIYRKIADGYQRFASRMTVLTVDWMNTVMARIPSFSVKKKRNRHADGHRSRGFLIDAFVIALRTLFPGHFILLLMLAFIGSKFGNFGTAFITLIVIFGLTRALTQVSISESMVPRHTVLCEMFIISMVYILAAMVGDQGYLTNYLGFVMCMVCFFFIMKRPVTYAQNKQTEKSWVNKLLVVLLIIIVILPFICSHLFSAEKVNYGRMARRVMLYSNFDDLQRSGYRYSESDAEFMVIMSHYMQKGEMNDPLSNDDHFLHASVSSGQSPVVLNDLSVPVAFFGSYGVARASIVYVLLLFILIWLVLQFSLSYADSRDPRLTSAMQWRLLAMFMWVGTSFYIYLSYIDRLPFTGRLNPGYGVDAVGEALETAILLAFMSAVTCRKRSSV